MLLQSAGRWRHLQTSATYFRPIGPLKWGRRTSPLQNWGRPHLCKIGPWGARRPLAPGIRGWGRDGGNSLWRIERRGETGPESGQFSNHGDDAHFETGAIRNQRTGPRTNGKMFLSFIIARNMLIWHCSQNATIQMTFARNWRNMCKWRTKWPPCRLIGQIRMPHWTQNRRFCVERWLRPPLRTYNPCEGSSDPRPCAG